MIHTLIKAIIPPKERIKVVAISIEDLIPNKLVVKQNTNQNSNNHQYFCLFTSPTPFFSITIIIPRGLTTLSAIIVLIFIRAWSIIS